MIAMLLQRGVSMRRARATLPRPRAANKQTTLRRPRRPLVRPLEIAVGCLFASSLFLAATPAFAVKPFATFPVTTSSANVGTITPGPDGAMWFVENSANKIGRISSNGAVTEYTIPTANSLPASIVAGPDGALWFTESSGHVVSGTDGNATAGAIGRITTSGQITNEYVVPLCLGYTGAEPNQITVGSDGKLWFTNSNGPEIGQITTGGAITMFWTVSPPPAELCGPSGLGGITAGPDGALWYASSSSCEPNCTAGGFIGRMTTAGSFTDYAAPAHFFPAFIASGSDGNLWFTMSTDNEVPDQTVGQVTTSGTITLFGTQAPTAQPITAGPDGALWFADGNWLWRLTTAGVFTEEAFLNISTGGIATGDPSGALWFTIPFRNNVNRLCMFSTNTHDFDGDCTSDILWLDGSGDVAMWLMSGGQLSSGAGLGNVGTSWSVVGTRDFNADGYADILWYNSGSLADWLMTGTSASSYNSLGNVGTQWSVAGTGDFNGDGTADILWRNGSTGDLSIWLMSNGQYSSGTDLGDVPLAWQVVGTGDFNGDGTTDILWRNGSTGDLAIWLLSNGQLSSGIDLGVVPSSWIVVGTGDFNGDGTSDILWRNNGSGELAIWLMSNGALSSGANIASVPLTWSVAETGDFNGDGKSDILWLDGSGDLGLWLMNGPSVSSAIGLGNVGTSWRVQGAGAD